MEANLAPHDVIQIVDKNAFPFWYEVLHAWSKINFSDPHSNCDQLIWCNSNIKIKDRVFFWKDCYDCGLLWLLQLLSGPETGWISEEEPKKSFNLGKMRFNSIKSATQPS